MESEILNKAICLIHETRVMTLGVSDNNIPWSSPVYFVFHDQGFCFFSNENSRHVQWAQNSRPVSASLFHDSDRMDQIFGFQMSGRVEAVTQTARYLLIVKKYVKKFNFLEQVFGAQILEKKGFFLEKFKSRLYCFYPDQVFLSDNSRPTDKRSTIDLTRIA